VVEAAEALRALVQGFLELEQRVAALLPGQGGLIYRQKTPTLTLLTLKTMEKYFFSLDHSLWKLAFLILVLMSISLFYFFYKVYLFFFFETLNDSHFAGKKKSSRQGARVCRESKLDTMRH